MQQLPTRYLFYIFFCLVTLVVSDSLWPHGLKPARLLYPWDFPGKNTGVGCHFLLQFYIGQCIYINTTLSIRPTLPYPSLAFLRRKLVALSSFPLPCTLGIDISQGLDKLFSGKCEINYWPRPTWGLPGGSEGKESACNVEDPDSIPWRTEWPPIPVFLPGEFHEQRSLESYSPWGCKESDTTKQLTHTDTYTHP